MSKMGGWWRLWLVISAVWVSLAAFVHMAEFPRDKTATARVGPDYTVTIENVPYTTSDKKLISKLQPLLDSERATPNKSKRFGAAKSRRKLFPSR